MRAITVVYTLIVSIFAVMEIAFGQGLVGSGEVKDYDVGAAFESSMPDHYYTISETPTVGELHISPDGKYKFTGKLVLILPTKITEKGIERDQSSDPEIILFNKNHNITVIMEKGAVAMLHGRHVKAEQKSTFKLVDNNDSELEKLTKEGSLTVITEKAMP